LDEFLVDLIVFIKLRDIFFYCLKFYFFILNDSLTRSILLVLIPFMINLEYNNAVDD